MRLETLERWLGRKPERMQLNLARTEAAKEFAQRLRETSLSSEIGQVVLFGSVAKYRDHEFSDIDLAVEVKTTEYIIQDLILRPIEAKLTEIGFQVTGERFPCRSGNVFHCTVLSTAQLLDGDSFSAVISAIQDDGIGI